MSTNTKTIHTTASERPAAVLSPTAELKALRATLRSQKAELRALVAARKARGKAKDRALAQWLLAAPFVAAIQDGDRLLNTDKSR